MRVAHLSVPILHREHPSERVALKVVCTLLILCACFYVYFVSASIVNIIARKEALVRASETSSAIAQLESEFFTLTEGITEEKAKELGLVAISEKHYVTRTTRLGRADAPRSGF